MRSHRWIYWEPKVHTVKPMSNGHSQKDQKLGFKAQVSLNAGQKKLQNAPRGAFCNNFDLHQATICH